MFKRVTDDGGDIKKHISVHSSRWFLALDLGPDLSPRAAGLSPPVAMEGSATATAVGEEKTVTEAVAEGQGGFGGRAKAGLGAVELWR